MKKITPEIYVIIWVNHQIVLKKKETEKGKIDHFVLQKYTKCLVCVRGRKIGIRDARLLTGGVMILESKPFTNFTDEASAKKGSRLEDMRSIFLSHGPLGLIHALMVKGSCVSISDLELCDVRYNTLGQWSAVDSVINSHRRFLSSHLLNHQSGCGHHLLIILVYKKKTQQRWIKNQSP